MATVARKLFSDNDHVVAFEPEVETGIDDLYADFTAQESEFVANGTGAFADPANRAFGFRMLIDQLLADDNGNKMRDGSRIPLCRLLMAIEKYEYASLNNVWDPIVNSQQVKTKCTRFQQAAEKMIEKAKANLSFDATISV